MSQEPPAPLVRLSPKETEIRLSLDAVDDLFVSFDPSRLVQRDIDNAIEEFIVEEATDAPRDRPIRISVQLPPQEAAMADETVLTAAFRNFFSFMRDREAARIKRMWREAREALSIGLVFLAVCIGLGLSARTLISGAAGVFLSESLAIAGWVANWKPIEMFLYDWRPLKRRRTVYDELSRVIVAVERRAMDDRSD